jgi:hypothetical protein
MGEGSYTYTLKMGGILHLYMESDFNATLKE